ncbi:MAG: aspartate kinase [Bacteroidaceae bacterium]|nr:aspartate kinase [Bacteroidaceae bacterium]MBQ8270520.1 aspartate kinase [Bacteroidaceae bacterium]
MKVLKFGGTSVGSADRIKSVVNLISDGETKIVVLSAMSGTTNSLIEFANYLRNGNATGACEFSTILQDKYKHTIRDLYSTPEYAEAANTKISEIFNHLRTLAYKPLTVDLEKEIIAQGEIMSTNMVALYMQELGIDVTLLNSFDFMRLSSNGEPDLAYIREHILPLVDLEAKGKIYIAQGFVCINHLGNIDNLQRGGSDYTATLLGAAVKAAEVQIWTDIDGMHNNDPRIVDNTSPVRHLHFEESAELAYFGAKILHPTCILPAKLTGTPVRLLNTMDPKAEGTLIDNNLTNPGEIKAIAAKDGITAVKIKSGRMLLAYGFLRKVFEVFETYRTSIDMICTSEVGVSVSIDDDRKLDDIVDELQKYGTVTIDRNMCIICVVGDLNWENIGFESRAMAAMKDIPVRMVSYGGSNYNISFLVREEDKERALRSLSETIFNTEK